MKRMLCIVLAVVLLLCACGDREREQSREEPESSSEPEQPVPGEPEEELPLIMRLVVPEGFTLPRIGMELEGMGICTAQEFIEAAQTGDFSGYPLVAEQKVDVRRCFLLEGYMFPDTYEVYRDEPPESIIRRMLDNMERRMDDGIRAQIAGSGFTADEILTIASIIEKESFGEENMPGVSSVLHNRLAAGMKLQCDVTINYVEGAIKPFVDESQQGFFNEYYNTYKCAKLPAGAICNPGLPAIRAALEPADTHYLYFFTDEDKNFIYADNYEEHRQKAREAGIETAG